MVDSVEIHAQESIDPSLAQLQEEIKEQENPTPEFVMPEKFEGKSAEEIAKSYIELEKMRSGGDKPAEDTPTSDEEATSTTPEETGETDDSKKESEGEPAGDKFQKFTDELRDSGELSEASYEELSKQGYPKEMVDAYISGQKAIQERDNASMEAKVFEQAGGKDAYTEMAKWASENFSTEEVESFDKAIVGTEYEQRVALNDLKTRFKEANGQPKLLSGKSVGNKSPGFSSMNELVNAQRDPRYTKDPDYRRKVEERLAVSQF